MFWIDIPFFLNLKFFIFFHATRIILLNFCVNMFRVYLGDISLLFIFVICVDLGRMYQLVSRIQDGLGQLKTLLETHIYNQGIAAIDKCGDSALNVSNQAIAAVVMFVHYSVKFRQAYDR